MCSSRALDCCGHSSQSTVCFGSSKAGSSFWYRSADSGPYNRDEKGLQSVVDTFHSQKADPTHRHIRAKYTRIASHIKSPIGLTHPIPIPNAFFPQIYSEQHSANEKLYKWWWTVAFVSLDLDQRQQVMSFGFAFPFLCD